MTCGEFDVLLVLGFLLLFGGFGAGLSLLLIFLKIVHSQLYDDQETRLAVLAGTLAQLLPGLLKIGGQVTEYVGQADEDGGALAVLYHGVEAVHDVAALHDLFCTAVVE